MGVYRQSVRTRGKAKGSGEKWEKKMRVRLIQLVVCVVLFCAVFVGKGVFPHRVEQTGGQLLALMERSMDVRGAFTDLGRSLANEENVLGELGSFCLAVFGGEEEAVPIMAAMETELDCERQFLNSTPDQAELMAHYLHMDEIPEGWLQSENQQQEQNDDAVQETEVPAVGTVLLKADYRGRELPDGCTMDYVALGSLETATPVLGNLWSGYGYRDHPIDGEYKFHNGVDIGAEEGASIGAFSAGTVEYIGQSESYGNYFQIDHGQGIKSFYAHCSQLLVERGQQVLPGEKVALVGSTGSATGPHLHFELKCGGMRIDPAYYIDYEVP